MIAPPVPATLNDNAPVAQIVEGAQEPAGLRFKLSKKDDGSVVLDFAAEPVSTGGPRFRALAASVGADNPDFCWGILKQVVNAANRDEDASNFALAVIQNIAPRDATEGLLAAQMSAAHVATMTAAGNMARADTLMKYEAYERAFNKLARTFAAQVEALKRYRSSGSQKVTVEHINVNDGGQAIVGNVTR